MQEKKSHDMKGYVLGLLFLSLSSIHIFAQCPATETVLLPLDQNGRGTVQVADFLSQAIILKESSISRSTFDCRNIGIQEVTLEGTTSTNAKFSCKQLVIVYDSMKICSNKIISPNAISGKIITENGIPVQNVTIGFSSDDVGFFRGTNEDGLFLLDDIPVNNYTIDAEKNTNQKNGVSTQDILTLQKHLLKIKRIRSPYQLIAADVNNSGSVTAFDMILIRQIILNAITDFPDNQSWKFIRMDYLFQNPEDPFKEVPAASYSVDFQPSIAANNNFIGVKIGDLNHSVIANQNQSTSRSNDAASFTIPNKVFKSGDQFTIAIQPDQALTLEGFQLALGVDASTLSIQSISGLPADTYSIERNQAIISLTDVEGLTFTSKETLFNITFIANKAGQLKEQLFLNEAVLANEWYDTNTEAHSIQLSFDTTLEGFAVAPNYPNPFTTITTLPFSLPNEGAVSISIFNSKGQVIWQKEASFLKGTNTVQLDAEYPSNGIYFYEMTYGQEQVRGKLNVVR